MLNTNFETDVKTLQTNFHSNWSNGAVMMYEFADTHSKAEILAWLEQKNLA